MGSESARAKLQICILLQHQGSNLPIDKPLHGTITLSHEACIHAVLSHTMPGTIALITVSTKQQSVSCERCGMEHPRSSKENVYYRVIKVLEIYQGVST